MISFTLGKKLESQTSNKKWKKLVLCYRLHNRNSCYMTFLSVNVPWTIMDKKNIPDNTYFRKCVPSNHSMKIYNSLYLKIPSPTTIQKWFVSRNIKRWKKTQTEALTLVILLSFMNPSVQILWVRRGFPLCALKILNQICFSFFHTLLNLNNFSCDYLYLLTPWFMIYIPLFRPRKS